MGDIYLPVQPFYAEGVRFSCKRCSACCRHDPGFVFLTPSDLAHLAEWASLTESQFIEVYCRWVPSGDGERLSLREKSNYDCILWDSGCIAYGARPIQCSTFPFWDNLLLDEDVWEAHTTGCPGMNSGEFHDIIEIEHRAKLRRKESIICRKTDGGQTECGSNSGE
jgi:Fe-S-cluster containining protein